MPSDPSDYRTAIVLQGGGALGAYELGVLRAIYDQRPGFRPAAVTGISIGAVTAAVLAGGRQGPVASLDSLWRDKLTVLPRLPGWPGWPGVPLPFVPRDVEQSLAVLGNPGMYRFNPELALAPWAATSVYDTSPLRRTLDELVDLDTLNAGDTRVVVGAIDVETALIRYFDNAAGDMTFDPVVASGSLPPGFPLTEIDGHRYWDGGLFSNTPLSPAINFLEGCEPDNPSIHRELIVVELFPMEGAAPQNLSAVVSRMVQLQYTSRIKLDQKLFDTISEWIELFGRIDAALPADDPLRGDALYRKLLAHRKIDSFKVIPARLDAELANAGDFSRASIEGRIDTGYDDAKRYGVGW
ncbi:MAG: patatin-like phospholipase family protein [Acidimicrobiia bacterium]